MGNSENYVLRVDAFSDAPLDVRYDENEGIYREFIAEKKKKPSTNVIIMMRKTIENMLNKQIF
jgi:hypothetical protein